MTETMNSDDELKKIGKRMPYTVPDDFFAQMEQNVMAEVKPEMQAKPKRIAARIAIWSTAIAAAASVALFIVVGGHKEVQQTSIPSSMEQVKQVVAQESSGEVDENQPVLASADAPQQPVAKTATPEAEVKAQPKRVAKKEAAQSPEKVAPKVVTDEDLDEAFNRLSDEDKELLVSSYQDDLFLNK